MEVATSEFTAGRNAVEYAAAERGVYAIGIDISRTYVCYALFIKLFPQVYSYIPI